MYRFRWASCQLDALEEYEMPNDLLKALDTLPDTLDETYRRILDGIPQIHLKNSTRILQFLTYAERPIKIREAVDILATTPEDDLKFDPGNRMPNPQGILKFCSSLVSISEEEIQLAHFSVKEYLASSRDKGLFESNLHESRAHESITKVLLAYMSSLKDLKGWKKDIHRMMQIFPLAAYGAECWMKHATRTEESRATRESILDFFEHRDALFICTSLINSDPNEDPDKVLLPLYLASMSGWKHIVEDLLSQNPDCINETGGGRFGSALNVACYHHRTDVVRMLLEKGADANLVSGNGDGFNTPLMTLFDGPGYDLVKLVKLLLEYGADPNARERNSGTRETPPENGKKQADISLAVGATPLIAAYMCGPEDLTQILLEKGALPNMRHGLGNTALSYACSGRSCYKFVDALLNYGADINLKNELGKTPFDIVCQSGEDEIIRLLLERNQMRNADALQITSFWGRLDAVNLLCSYGVDPNENEGGYGPALHTASSRGHLRIVELLLDRGADPHGLDCHRWTALFLAIKNGHDDVSKALWQLSRYGPLFRCLSPSTFIQSESSGLDINVSERTLDAGIHPREALDLFYMTKYFVVIQAPMVLHNALSDHPFVATARNIYFEIKALPSEWTK